jgi:nucleoside-diphosphate-sugar epimerase
VLLIFVPGYAAGFIARAARGMAVTGVTREGLGDSIGFADAARVRDAIARASHILSSVPPEEGDPVLARYADALAASPAWLGYLSSTGVYGDTGGAWVDETAPTGTGRRAARAEADAAWLALGARVFRLPGIYGPGRSALDRPGRRIDAGAQVFSRIHVEDIAHAVVAGFEAPPGAYNIADDCPAPQGDVIAYACRLRGLPVPPLVALDAAALTPAARAFYSESRRIANGKARRVLGWRPRYPDYRAGLRALSAMTSPASASMPPAAASHDQR